jgi:hypothetical protein
MADSFAAQLDRVQAAIAAIETGKVQSYSIGNQSFTKLDLPALYVREERLLRKLARGTDSGRRVVEL